MKTILAAVAMLATVGCATAETVPADSPLVGSNIHDFAYGYLDWRLERPFAGRDALLECYANYVETLYSPSERQQFMALTKVGAPYNPNEAIKVLDNKMKPPADKILAKDYSDINGLCPQVVARAADTR